MDILERRFESRYLCADLARVTWEDKDTHSTSPSVEAVVEDISSLGACVEVERSIPLGSAISLSLGEQDLRGHVCYSVFRDYGYLVGIRFSDETRWSRESAKPRHLFNVADMTGY